MSCKEAGLVFLSHKIRTKKEIIDYLQKKSFEDEEIATTIKYLQNHNYINDIDYCKHYYRYAASKGRGLWRIKRELYEKGVSNLDVEHSFFQMEEDENINLEKNERINALKVASKVYKSQGLSEKLPDKIGRKLNSLGYDMSLIYEIVGKYRREYLKRKERANE